MDRLPLLLAFKSDSPLGIASAGHNLRITIYTLKIYLVKKDNCL